MHTASQYERDGIAKVVVSHTAALRSANKQLNSAKAATPERLRDQFSSSIRFDRISSAYYWMWYLL